MNWFWFIAVFLVSFAVWRYPVYIKRIYIQRDKTLIWGCEKVCLYKAVYYVLTDYNAHFISKSNSQHWLNIGKEVY